MKKLLLVGLVAMLGGCVTMTPAKVYTFDKSRTYSKSYDAVWKKLTQFYATNNISIKTIEKDSGVIYADRAGVPKEMVACDGAAYVNPKGSMNTFVEKVSKGVTKVTVNTSFSDTYVGPSTGIVVPLKCNSTGVLEKQILDYLN